MTPASIDFARERVMALVSFAGLLQRFDSGAIAFNAAQYQAVVKRLKSAMRSNVDPATLQSVLDAHPAAAELYENLHYEAAGLSRTPLDLSVSSERRAAEAIARWQR